MVWQFYLYRRTEQRNVTGQLLQAALAQFAIMAIIVIGLKGYYYSRLFLVVFFSAFYTFAWLGELFMWSTSVGSWRLESGTENISSLVITL